MRIIPATGWAILFFFACASALVHAETKRYVYTVKGRIIDEKGNPVSHVTVALRSRHYSEGDLVYLDSPDEFGRFIIQKKSTIPVWDWRLWVSDSSRVPENTNELLDWNTTFCGEYYKSLCGKKVHVFPNRITELGDIRLTVRQYPLLVRFSDVQGKPLISERDLSGDGFDPNWRVRDPLGDIIGEGGNAYVHFRSAQSAVMIALPSGKWTLDIYDDNGSGLGGLFDIDVLPSETVRELDFHLQKYRENESFTGRVHYSPTGRKEARRQIRALGFEPTQAGFEQRVMLGNHKLVELYLRAGMNPNVLTKNQDLLMSAIDRPKVLKLLLEAGADVNRRVDGDITPLLQAVGWLIIPADTVKMLLDAGADINAQDKDRRDVFRLAQDRKEILTILKEYKSKMH